MINYIVYGNTSYLDILQIQTDYMSGRGHLTLFIDANTMELSDLYSKYDKVVLYNGQDQYAKRLIKCLEQVDYEYFLFIHDIDILLDIDYVKLNKLNEFITSNNFDRLDLKHTDNTTSNLIIEMDINKECSDWNVMMQDELTDGIYLVKQDNPNDYIYNVNPSIWKKSAFVELLDAFPHKTYRTIEEMDVQVFCKKFKVFKMHSINHLQCGYFKTLDMFKFLHISHSGKILPLNESFTTVYGQSYSDISVEYTKIVNKYDLRKSPKWIN
jgi:hypothetical protein